jgi:hypothetical protein
MIQVSDDFNNPLGEFPNYDTKSNITNLLVSGLKHVDIRGFLPYSTDYASAEMLTLDGLTMTQIDQLTMAQLDGSNTDLGDNWSAGGIGHLSGLNNIPALIVGVSGMLTTTSTGQPVDLTSFAPTDTVSLTLPNFPLTGINISGCSLGLSESSSSVNLPFLESLTPIIEGPSEASWPVSALGSTLNPTTVSITLEPASSPVTVEIAGIRVLAEDWEPFGLDQNTQRQSLNMILTPSGTMPNTSFPTVYRANNPPGYLDPLPINADWGFLFYTGSLEYNNTVNLFFRNRNEALITQVDLDGDTQAYLDSLGYQPDFGVSQYVPNTQAILNTYDQAYLNTLDQDELERIFDVTNESYVQASFIWGPNTTDIALSNYEANSTGTYNFTASGLIHPNSTYLFQASLQDNSMRAILSPVVNGEAGIALMDTLLIDNSFIFQRNPGRIGWGASLQDGDAYIASFNAFSLVYAVYQSKPFNSRTPVNGVQLSVSATDPTELYTGAGPLGDALLAIDMTVSDSANGSIRVAQSAPTQGIITYPFQVTDWTNLFIRFDLYWPSSMISQGYYPLVCLVNETGLLIDLPIGYIPANSWQTYYVEPTNAYNVVSGAFQLIFTSLAPSATWWIDNLSVQERAIGWFARSAPQDPWNADPIPWIDMRTLLNSATDGVVLSPAGNALQVQALAYNPSATIQKILITPSYKQLGSLVWP